jgi:sirohydrochlorin cobaltochelatase
MQALILFAHGSRDTAWRAPFDTVAARVRELRPDAQVSVAFLEFAAPSLPDAVADAAARGATAIGIVPMFLGLGGHLRHDMPGIVAAARARVPGVAVTVTPSLGEAEDVLQAMATWLAAMHPK